jgi:hypothetical protein
VVPLLRDEDLRIDLGLASHGGDFTRMVHIPTGIERSHPGPLKGVNIHELRKRWRDEIESELKSLGLTQYIVPQTKHKSEQSGGATT